MTFVTLECVRARVWLLPSLRSVAACVWPWLPERVVDVPCVTYLLTYLLNYLINYIRKRMGLRETSRGVKKVFTIAFLSLLVGLEPIHLRRERRAR